MGNYYLYRIAEFITGYLPLSLSYAVAVFLADCQYFLSKNDRKAVEDNLKNILKTDQVPSYMVRDVFRYFGKHLVDFFTITKRVNKDFIKSSVQISGVEQLNEVIHKGKGGILVSAHLGNWEMGGAVLSLLGYPMSVVALAHKDDRVNVFFNKKREFFGAVVIQTNVAIRRCLGHLKRNRIVAILADRDFGHHGLYRSFFGKKSVIPKGAALFALKTGAPIIPAFFLRTDNNHFQIIIKDPIYPPPEAQRGTDEVEVENLVSKYLYLIEEQIQQNPSQWLMFYPFEVK
ncbi:MAG: lysophospholipid acyltransferase family protein [Candidatus Omnitrophica bacterium]|nr:lysophospholipid acyltransferase family protein [Candidatus Omnitrophota bacterium]